MDPDTFLTAVYVIVDDLCQAKSGEVRPKRRGRKPVLSESDVITLALLSQWHGRGSERAFLRFAARHWRSYFPLLGQSGFNKRVRALRSRIAELALEVGRQVHRLMGTGSVYEAMDGVIVPLMRCCRGERRLYSKSHRTQAYASARTPSSTWCARIQSQSRGTPIPGPSGA